MIAFTANGQPQPAGSKTRNRYGGVRDDNPKTKPWQNQVAQRAAEAMNGRELFRDPLMVKLVFCRPRPKSHYGKRGLLPSAPAFPTTRPDVLKLARAVEDAMAGIVYRDDAQIVREVLVKRYDEPARVEVRVTAIGSLLLDEPEREER